MSEHYDCNVCGRTFHLASNRDEHQRVDHQGSITDYSDSEELQKLQAMCKALSSNDYDVENRESSKSTQRTLRNKKAENKGLNEKTTRQKTLNSL